ncbi:MAG: hypothetical protein K0Q94_6352 [Paenibacillus sp.]|jgi:chemotaxis protein histidine kinase CheA|nr:hypothetical protein [Paenibacillus sp.]
MAHSDDDYNEKLKRIIRQAQTLFLQDAASRMSEVETGLRQWTEHELSFDETVELIHRHVHALKGVALTIHYDDIDLVCKQILERIHTVEADRAAGKSCDETAGQHEMDEFASELGLLRQLLAQYS